MPGLLVFTPTYGDALRPETVASVNAQQFDGSLTHEISYHNPYPIGDMRNVTAQYQRARDLLLAGDYDALLTVEHDMVLPPDAAQRLWDTDAPVVYGVYMLRHGSNVLNLWRYTGGRNLGMSLSLYPDELRRARRAKTWRVSGVGFGCTLIRREVLERIPFRQDPSGNAPDIPFALDCLQRGVVAVGRFDVACGHIEGGKVLKPYVNGGIVARAYALQDVTVNVEGESRRLVKDRYYTLPLPVAGELARAGYVRLTNMPDPASRETATAEPEREQAVATVTKRRKKKG